MRMPSQEKTLQRLQNPAETLCERPRAGTARRRLRHSQARRAKRKSIPGRRMHALQRREQATASRRSTRAAPPPPPLRLSPLLACDPATAPEVQVEARAVPANAGKPWLPARDVELKLTGIPADGKVDAGARRLGRGGHRMVQQGQRAGAVVVGDAGLRLLAQVVRLPGAELTLMCIVHLAGNACGKGPVA